MRFLVCLAVAFAVQPARAADAEYRVEIDPRSVFSTVRSVQGRDARFVSLQFQLKRLVDSAIITGVPKEEIVVEEDGQKVAGLEVIQPRSQKLTVVLALDISGSMARGKKIDAAKQAAQAFLDRLDDRAEAGLVLFDHEVREAIPPSRDKEAIRRAIRAAEPAGGTAYLDAAVRSVEMLKGVEGRRVVIVLTDGVDMNSKVGLADAIRTCQTAEVPIYTVGIGEPGRDTPVTTVLVLDHSGSMGERAGEGEVVTKIEALKRAAARFVELMRPNAQTTLLPFADEPDRAEPFTRNRDDLLRRIDALEAKGGTALYAATFDGIEALQGQGGRRAVVVLTDGMDQPLRRTHNANGVIAKAKEVGVSLYMLGLGQKREIDERAMKRMAKETNGDYFHAGSEAKLIEVFEKLSIQLHDDGIDEKSLGELASKTGGKYTHVSKASELSEFYERLADELQTTYRVTFESGRSSHDGTARGIDVKVVRDGRDISTGGAALDVARGVVVPRLSYGVYLFFLVALTLLLGVPAAVRRIYRAFGGV